AKLTPALNGFGAGYYYRDFEAVEGGRQLRVAAAEHDERLGDQRRATRAVFDAVDPFSAANLNAYAGLLRQLCQDTPEWFAA
ncbi:MAG: DUF2827 family protein, partial [Comamonadaceae bacterium]